MGMKCLEITTTVPCINNCSYCPQDVLKSNYNGHRTLHLSSFKYYINKVPASVKIHFSGMSEPFGNNSCIEMIEYAYDKGHEVGLYTTLCGAIQGDIKRLAQMKIRPFGVHLNYMYFPLKNELERLIDDFVYIEVGDHEYTFFETSDVVDRGHMTIQQETISRAGLLWDEKRKTGKLTCVDNRQNQNVLLPSGDVVLCCNDYSLKHKLGNLNDMSYDELFKGDEYSKIMKGFKDDTIDTICRTCNRAVEVE